MIGKEALECFLKDYTADKSAVLMAYHKKGEPAEIYCGGYSDDLFALLIAATEKLARNMGMQPLTMLHMMGEVLDAIAAKEQKEPMQ